MQSGSIPSATHVLNPTVTTTPPPTEGRLVPLIQILSRPRAINPHLKRAAAFESSHLHSKPTGSFYGGPPPILIQLNPPVSLGGSLPSPSGCRNLLAPCSWAHSLPRNAGSQLQPPHEASAVAPGPLAPQALRNWELFPSFLVRVQLTFLGRGLEGNPCPPVKLPDTRHYTAEIHPYPADARS